MSQSDRESNEFNAVVCDNLQIVHQCLLGIYQAGRFVKMVATRSCSSRIGPWDRETYSLDAEGRKSKGDGGFKSNRVTWSVLAWRSLSEPRQHHHGRQWPDRTTIVANETHIISRTRLTCHSSHRYGILASHLAIMFGQIIRQADSSSWISRRSRTWSCSSIDRLMRLVRFWASNCLSGRACATWSYAGTSVILHFNSEIVPVFEGLHLSPYFSRCIDTAQRRWGPLLWRSWSTIRDQWRKRNKPSCCCLLPCSGRKQIYMCVCVKKE